MIREIITFGNYFEEFLKVVSPKVTQKVDYILGIIET